MSICTVCGAVMPSGKKHNCKGEPLVETLSIKEIQDKVNVIEAKTNVT